MLTIKERVQNGIRFISRQKKKAAKVWMKRINLKKLDINYSMECIIGQLYGDYYDNFPESNINHEDYGFKPKDYNIDPIDHENLTKEWRKQIKRELKS